MNIIEELDRLYKEWSGVSHLENSNRMVHDSAEAQDFARFCIDELKILNGDILDRSESVCDHYFPIYTDTGGTHYLPCEFCGLVKQTDLERS